MKRLLVSGSRASCLLIIALLIMAPVRAQDDAASIFKSKCVVCHGADGSGNTKMGMQLKAADLRSDDVQKLTDEQLTDVVTNGKNGKMPAWGEILKPEQIKGLIVYVRSLASKNKTK